MNTNPHSLRNCPDCGGSGECRDTTACDTSHCYNCGGTGDIAPPRFQHDCDNCLFLGRFRATPKSKPVDLYVCSRRNIIDTVIARYGNYCSNYASSIVVVGMQMCCPELVEALRHAQDLGLKVPDSIQH